MRPKAGAWVSREQLSVLLLLVDSGGQWVGSWGAVDEQLMVCLLLVLRLGWSVMTSCVSGLATMFGLA
jgi:hypothetical protein